MSRARRQASATRTIRASYCSRRARDAAFYAAAQARLDEERDRYSFWMLTDDELPGAEAFARRLCAFDAMARRAGFATLEVHRILREVPDD